MREATLAFAILSFVSIIVIGVLILNKVGVAPASPMSDSAKL